MNEESVKYGRNLAAVVTVFRLAFGATGEIGANPRRVNIAFNWLDNTGFSSVMNVYVNSAINSNHLCSCEFSPPYIEFPVEKFGNLCQLRFQVTPRGAGAASLSVIEVVAK
jgi:hypothetical protein